jgi:hypothetical protein
VVVVDSEWDCCVRDLAIVVAGESTAGAVHQGLGFQIALTSSEGGALQRRILADWETEEERADDCTCSGVVFIIVCPSQSSSKVSWLPLL